MSKLQTVHLVAKKDECGVFLATIGADEVQIEAAFSEAIRIAKKQKSVSLEKRAETTFAEYGRQKASASTERRVRLSLW